MSGRVTTYSKARSSKYPYALATRLRYAVVANESVFTRYPGDPIVTAQAVPRANSIHSPAIVRRGEVD